MYKRQAGESGQFFFEAIDADVLAAYGAVEEAGVFAHQRAAEIGVIVFAAEILSLIHI